MQMFAPGGSWNEGLGYFQLVMNSLVPYASNMEKCFGSSYNIMVGQGMENVLDFVMACL